MRRFLFPIWEELNLPRPNPEQVRLYMLAHGWQERPYGPELLVFEGPKDDANQTIVQVLPSSADMPAYPQRLLDLLNALCRIEDRLIRHILTDMLASESNGFTPAETSANDTLTTKKARRPKERRA